MNEARGRSGLSRYDAWVMARVRSGWSDGWEVSRVTPALRMIVQAMAAVAPGEREAMFSSYLSVVSDRGATLRAICDADPMGPAPAPEPSEAPARLSAKVTRASDVKPEPVEWLWEGRVPLGALTQWVGAPKLGKSHASLALASSVTRGTAMPMARPPEGPGSVVLMSAEDDPSRTIVPRLIAAGADLERVHILESVLTKDGEEALPSLSIDLETIAGVAEGLGDCRLIVIDPVSAYLGGVDDYRNTELRRALTPLADRAKRLRTAVVLLHHTNKNSTGGPLNRSNGSIAYGGLCRANALFVPDRSCPGVRRVLMVDAGGNLAPTAPTLAYSIVDPGDGDRLVWQDGAVAMTAEEALAAEQAASLFDPDAPERREAEDWLKDFLADGPHTANDVQAAAKRAGFSHVTLKRAKRALQVASKRRGFGRDAEYEWCLN